MRYAGDMLKESVISHFGSPSNVAKALGIGRAAVSKWGLLVPPLRAAQIEQLTHKKLRFDIARYADWYSNKPDSVEQA